MNASRQPVRVVVLHVDGGLEGRRVHDAEHRTEALDLMEPRAGRDAEPDTGPPEAPCFVELLGFHQPAFVPIELREPAGQLAVDRIDRRTHRRGQLPRLADLQALHGIDELASESRRLVDIAHADGQGGR